MKNTNATDTQTFAARTASAQRIRDIGEERGMRLYRVIDLLLEGWDLLSEEQQFQAHRQLFSRARVKQPA